MSEIVVKVGSTSVLSASEELVDIVETADGVIFSFKGGLSVSYVDPYMPSTCKQVIKNTADRMKGKKVVFEPTNYKQPALVFAD